MTKEERDAVQARCVSIDNIIIGIERELRMLRTHLDILTKVCKTEPITHDDYIESENDHLEARCLNCANGGSYKCSKCDGEMYFKDEPQTVRSNLEPFRVDEPQTERSSE